MPLDETKNDTEEAGRTGIAGAIFSPNVVDSSKIVERDNILRAYLT
jgi:hypothetical protein